MPADSSQRVSVIVTTRNSARTLEACLLSIRSQAYSNLELIVVDNSSTDSTVSISQLFADTLVTHGPERSAQRNRGAAIAAGDYLLFIDADMVLEPGVVSEALEALHRSGLPAAIIPEETVGVGFWTRCRRLERSCYKGDDMVEAARFYRRDAFMAVGGFDEQMNGGEDWDLSRRVSGRRRLPRCQAIIRHDEGRTRLRSVYAKRRYYAPGYLRYLRKHGRPAVAQGNPVVRPAFLRHWRRLARHPLLSAGMISLKVVELAAVLEAALWRRSDASDSPRSDQRIYG